MPPLPLRPQIPAPAAWLVALVAAAQAWAFWPLFTADMTAYLIPWLETIRERGMLSAFAQPFSNYMPSYLYLLALFSPLVSLLDPVSVIKLLSVAGTAALALAFHRLLAALGASERARWAMLLVVLPSVALNALLLGQCDAIYVAACVMAVAAALERRHLAMFAWCGIAIAFKAQAVLVAPFFLALAIQRRVPLRLWLAAPAALLGMMLPALLAGWPPADLATVYFRQAGTFSNEIARNAPNIWSLVGAIAPVEAPQLFALALATALGAGAAYVARMQAARLDRAGLVGMAALAVLLMTGLLPRMHERYFLLADVLILAFAVARGTRAAFLLAALVQLGSTAAILGYLGLGIPLVAAGALCMIAATWIAARPLIVPHANDNRDGPHGIPPPHGLRGQLSFDMLRPPVAPVPGE
ncbi:glycosyltransferase 87 family protein [Sphingomonas sp. BT-65]|uniref:glycosyltransferase 87 family protein n=1 Tax=Sphingomonas sp. BT-65 TaxID=2989821 RepID=UPI002236B2C1|nr:glycosyltransferase 87 family protein [Sphingomonas sp. BT-65]MCW4463702.1 glycosyltransferase 87 family protein [Sphingomonas sp. BT-65]